MSRHNYTNPAFCQQSEFYPSPSQRQPAVEEFPNGFCDENALGNSISVERGNSGKRGKVLIYRSQSTRSFRAAVKKSNGVQNQSFSNNNNHRTLSPYGTPTKRSLNYEIPPKPGPKPSSLLNSGSNKSFENRSGSGRYALVPVEELSSTAKSRYAILPTPVINTAQRLTKSQDDIDRCDQFPNEEDEDEDELDNNYQRQHASFHEESDTFKSLPTFNGGNNNESQPRLKSAFSSDFGSKSFVLVDQKSNQRYAVVPTEEDEDIVDDNHEIIQMHNGRAHRYAVIPTDEEETCLSTSNLNQQQKIHSNNNNYSTIEDSPHRSYPVHTSTPEKNIQRKQQQQRQQRIQEQQQQMQISSSFKNPIATRKLHEILSTPPRKVPIQRAQSTRNVYQQATNNNVQLHESQPTVLMGSPTKKFQVSPQKYEATAKHLYIEPRTTAVITPRVAHFDNQIDDEASVNKSWNDDSYPKKVANATATLGVVSLMLILGSILNSGLCLYMIANIGRSFYLEFGLTAAFAGVGLGILGYKSRYSDWLPNRSYVSGYILVTVFCLLKCCGLLILLALIPTPGTPVHDVTTGVVLGLSTFSIFFIGLGVIGSYWCYRPPPDNRVNVY